MEKENKTGIQELKNEAVEEAMKAFLADKTNQTMANLMAVMRDARFLVPAACEAAGKELAANA